MVLTLLPSGNSLPLMDSVQPAQGQSVQRNRVAPAWRDELDRQDRSLGWLARKTGKSTSAVSRYANGTLPTPAEWLRDVERVLGVEFAG